MAEPSARLAAFAATLDIADIPQAALEAASRSLLDIAGVAIRGREHAVAASGLAGARALSSGSAQAVVWGTGERLDIAAAVLANGIAAHVDDFDDTHGNGIVHGSAVIAPVVVALGAAQACSGADMLAALVAGWEVAARVGLASRGTFHERGFHTTSIAGVFGATAAAARLLRLAPAQATHALGLAGSQASGINEYLTNGSSSKALHCGWAAHAGIVAARLAQGGMTGPATVFEGRRGVLAGYGHPERCDPAQLDAELGSRWEVRQVSIKPYPCCHWVHAFFDCAVRLRERGIGAGDIRSITCVVDPLEVPMVCEPRDDKLAPATPYVAKFSLPFVVATGVLDGKVGHATFESANLGRSDLRALAQRVHYRVAEPGETPFPRTYPGRLTAELHDGRSIEERLDTNLGHPDNPLSFAQVQAKFRDNAGRALGEAGVRRVIEAVQDLPRMSAQAFSATLAAPAG